MSGEGVLAKYAKYGLGVYIYVYIYIYLPQFPRNKCFCSFFNLMPKSRGWGEEGGHREPGMREKFKKFISAF